MKQITSRTAEKGTYYLIYNPHGYLTICKCRCPEDDVNIGIYDDVVPYIMVNYDKECDTIFLELTEGGITRLTEFDNDLIFELSDEEVHTHVVLEVI